MMYYQHLRYDYWDANKNKEFRHAMEVMRELGITWRHAFGRSGAESFHFWHCENVPDVLPTYIAIWHSGPMTYIGHGLTEEEAFNIENWSPAK